MAIGGDLPGEPVTVAEDESRGRALCFTRRFLYIALFSSSIALILVFKPDISVSKLPMRALVLDIPVASCGLRLYKLTSRSATNKPVNFTELGVAREELLLSDPITVITCREVG